MTSLPVLLLLFFGVTLLLVIGVIVLVRRRLAGGRGDGRPTVGRDRRTMPVPTKED